MSRARALAAVLRCGLLVAASVAAGCGPRAALPDNMAAVAREPVVLGVAWRLQLADPAPLTAVPIESGGAGVSPSGRVVVAALASGDLVRLRPEDGSVVWRSSLGHDALTAPATVDDDAIYVIDGRGDLRRLAVDGGQTQWTAPLEDTFRAAPTLAGGRVYALSVTGALYAVDAATGALRWQYRRAGATELAISGGGAATVAGDTVYAGFPDGTLAAIDLDGSERWLADLGDGEARFRDVDSTPAVVGDTVIAASFSGGVWAIDAATGARRWHYELEGVTSLVETAAGVVGAGLDGEVVWLDPADGSLRFAIALDAASPGAPVPHGEVVLVPTHDAGLFVLDGRAPWIHHRFDPSAGFDAPPVARGGRVYGLSRAGFLYALDLVVAD